MRFIKLFLAVFLIYYLVSCEVKENTTTQQTTTTVNETTTNMTTVSTTEENVTTITDEIETTEEITTTTSDLITTTTTEVITTTEEIITTTTEPVDFIPYLNLAINELNTSSNIRIFEGIGIEYDTTSHVFDRYYSVTNTLNNYITKVESFYETNEYTDSDSYYITYENDSFYMYYYNQANLIKSEMDVTSTAGSMNQMYNFTFGNDFSDLTFSRQYTENGEEFIELTKTFRPIDLPPEYLSMFSYEIQNLMNIYVSTGYYYTDITETVLINKTQGYFESISYDLADLVQNTTVSTLKNLEAEYFYIFTNRNEVTFDTSIFDYAIDDDAPNDKAQSYLLMSEVTYDNFIIGNLDYGGDIDYYLLHIDESNKYYFDPGNMPIAVYTDYGKLIKESSEPFAYTLEPDDYYLVVNPSGKLNNIGGYNVDIELITQDDYADNIHDNYPIQILSPEDSPLTGNIDFINDVDILRLDSEGLNEVYTFNLTSTDEVSVYYYSGTIDSHPEYKSTTIDGTLTFDIPMGSTSRGYLIIQGKNLCSYELTYNLSIN